MVETIKVTYRDGAYYVDRPNWDGGEVVPADDYDTLAAEVERMAKELAGLKSEMEEWLTARDAEMEVSFDAGHYRAMSEHATPWRVRAEKAEAEVERLRAINANLMGDDEDAPRYTTKRLKSEVAKAVEAARAEASAAVKVKALEWGSGYASTMFGGGYLITYYAGMKEPAKLETRGWWDGDGAGHFETVEAAKSAAQADYERRILSALTTQPAAPQEAEACAVDCAGKSHDDPAHYWRWACIKCGVFRGSDLHVSPPAQAVTEAQVDAAVQAVRKYTRETLFIEEHRELVRNALTAAQEASR